MAGLESELTDGHAEGGAEVQLAAVLDLPAGRFEEPVNGLSRSLYRCSHGGKTAIGGPRPGCRPRTGSPDTGAGAYPARHT